MNKWARTAKIATAVGGAFVMTPELAYGAYVDVGESSGLKMADKVGLSTQLKLWANAPPGQNLELGHGEHIIIKWRDGYVRVGFEQANNGRNYQNQGQYWIIVQKVTLQPDGSMSSIEPYITADDKVEAPPPVGK